ncbi:MAG TPA: hypothetical protein ENJ19_04395, partial [Gammaproteobacteria bacterium]|nr:hypothetical protein [Gammaproteobacteria bacterium]
MNKKLLSVAIAAALGLAGCGGGSSTSSTNDTSQNDSSNNTQQNDDGEIISALSEGFALPTELSAVPADSDNSAQAALAAGLGPRLRALSRAVAVDELPADSDYAKAQPKKYIEERALEQFEVIEQVLNAVGQTHYADAGNVNEGPYTAMVTWVDDQDGRQVKTLQPWVVDSRMIVIDGQDVNRVLAWIEEPSEEVPGTTELIKAEFKIYKAATVAADGAFIDYGDWDLNVSFGEDSSGTVTDYFAATSRVSDGVTTIKIHESFPDGPPGAGGEAATYELKGILVRSATSGYGKVAFPDWESCFGPDAGADCTPDTKEVAYAYNAAFLGVDDDPATEGAVYKDRDPANAVEFTHRYGLFYANADSDNSIGAGDNVERHKAFGFPIRYTDDHGLTRYAYYGAWQGRHEIWGGERDGVAAGTEVTRDDRGPNQTAETYTVSDKFNGTLTKRTLVDGSLSDIQGIVVETWINKHWDLMWDQSANNGDGAWMYCDGWT